jgi:hypothetical protein
MTSFDPDTQEQDTHVTQDIYTRLGGKLALNCSVVNGGVIRVGSEVQLLSGAELVSALTPR